MAVQKECMYLDGQMKNPNPKRYKGDDTISSFILSLNEERIIVFLKKNQPGKLTN